MPRHSSGQPGAMVTDRDHRRSWSIGSVLVILVAAAALAGLGYLLYANAAHARLDRQHAVASHSGAPEVDRARAIEPVP